METNRTDKKSIAYYMRVLHRDVGFLLVGLTIVYALSGIVLIYRQTDFLKSPVQVERTLPQQLSAGDLGKELRSTRLTETKTDGDMIYFQDGTRLQNGIYNKATGAVSYVEKRLPAFLERSILLHKVSSTNGMHWFSVVYGAMLLFLAISSFWMFKPNTRQFRRGLILAGAGLILTLAILLLI